MGKKGATQLLWRVLKKKKEKKKLKLLLSIAEEHALFAGRFVLWPSSSCLSLYFFFF